MSTEAAPRPSAPAAPAVRVLAQARFEAMGHTAGSVPPAPAAFNPDYPCTLDLRRDF